MFPTALLTTLLFALSIAANPVLVNRSPVTLPISRQVNLTSVLNLLLHDQVRAKALKGHIVNEPIQNQAVSYVASVGVGSPPTTCKYYILFRVL